MFTARETKNKFFEYEIIDNGNGSYIKVVPEMGGIMTEFNIKGENILYLDRDRFYNGNSITAGGIPVLFPICGRLADGKYTYGGKTYCMDLHGFARTLRWKVADFNHHTEGGITVELTESEETLEQYPFRFKVEIKYVLKGNEVHVIQRYTNRSDVEMPFYAGFHPYFAVGGKNRLRFDIKAEKYIDYNDGCVKEYKGSIDFSSPVDFVFYLKDSDSLKNSDSFSYEMTDPDKGRKIAIEAAREFKYMVMWTKMDKNFVCLEPWMAVPNALNTGEGLMKLAPGESLNTWFKISVKMGMI